MNQVFTPARPLFDSNRSRGLFRHLNGRGLLLGLGATAPLFGLTLATGNPAWLRASLLGVSLVLGWQQSHLAPLGVIAQALAVTALFLLLAAARDNAMAFSCLCAAAAASVVRVGELGTRLRTLAAFTFIPAVYLAYDVTTETFGHGDISTHGFSAALATIPALAASLAAVLALMTYDRWGLARPAGHPRLFEIGDFGHRRPHGSSTLAAAASVGLVAALAVVLPLTSGQWAIWSALSIVTAETGLEGRKLRDRTCGALLGVPLGIMASFCVPHGPLVQDGALLLAVLTLVAIRHYAACVTMRWSLVALAATTSGEPMLAVSERVFDVSAGGAVGLLVVVLSRYGSSLNTRRFAKKAAARRLAEPSQAGGARTTRIEPC